MDTFFGQAERAAVRVVRDKAEGAFDDVAYGGDLRWVLERVREDRV